VSVGKVAAGDWLTRREVCGWRDGMQHFINHWKLIQHVDCTVRLVVLLE